MLAAVSVRTIALISGPLVGLGYFVGTIPWRQLHRRHQLNTETITADDARTATSADGRQGELPVVMAEAATPLLLAVLVMIGIERIAPGGQGGFQQGSAIGALSNQIIPVWDSVAMWTGAAAVLGHVAPIWTRFRGGTGIPAVMALALFFAPWVFVAVVAGYLAAFWFLRNRRPAMLIGFLCGLTYAWIGWVWELRSAWGVNFGPELALWSAVLMALLSPRILLTDDYFDAEDPLSS